MSKRSDRYEPGMHITHDSRTHKVTVTFRGRIVELPEPCETEDQAIHAGEAYCAEHGWRPAKPRDSHAGRSILRH